MARRPKSYQAVTITDGVRASAGRTPGKTALTLNEDGLTYAKLVERIDRVSAAIGAIADAGDHVALMAPNCLEFVEIVCGCSEAGHAVAMVNPRLTPPEVAYICNDSGARVLFVHKALEETARAADLETVKRIIVIGGDYEDWMMSAKPRRPDRHPDEWDVFSIPYTAGTTGNPKGVLLPHRSRALAFFGMAVEYGCYSPRDRALAIAPMFHGAGFAFAMAPVFFGGSLDILPSFDPEPVLRRLKEGGCTNTFMVPTHFNALFGLGAKTLEAYRKLELGTIISNAAPLPQATKERIVDYFGDGVLYECYGSTEGGIVTNLPPPDQLRKEQCVGLPFPCTYVRLLGEDGREVPAGEVGELYSSSPYLFNGYWRKPRETRDAFRDGWLSVGDLARKDEEGYVYLVDRKKDMIISGGVNIYPREIEEVLAAHGAVAETAVIGVPDDYWGEAIKAYVVLRGGESASADDLLEYCSGNLARYKLPKSFEFLDALPRNAAGKILKRQLRSDA